MILHKGEILFRQGDSGSLYRLVSGLLKIVRLHEDGTPTLVNIIVPNEIIPHHSLISPNPNYGTAIALVTCEVEVLPAAAWYRDLEANPGKCRDIALLLQDKLRMMQKRIDQLTEVAPADKLRKLRDWFASYFKDVPLTELLTQDEIAQFVGLRRETVNRVLRSQAEAKLPAGPKNS
ncbi:Crp/Fnr family transcriptional regulator [Cohnella sp. CIP 111063]|uniref:Crp/Fnr family transcriptional regulator n=1 Tax=unclassified Cohnella TaxID=2636738 RepID=UPI000B8C26AE|nr:MULTISPECIES: Crp/Fnr family transcriptional regulator [unclassified Cohnella]OXS57597.1 Crp/Fnr family transcriptional regulator [Cohnella sp. CIP 111063]PRX70976.1 CRP-like cAMP-binding protein [Cohnella sp. SGD-V74]